MTAPDDLDAWLRLLHTDGVGRGAARRLLAACGSADAVFATAASTLREVVGPARATALASPPDGHAERVAAARAWLAAGDDRRIVVVGDAAYPARLLQTADPPLLLYVQGRVEALAADGVAVVGSRHPTAQGRDNAHAFAAALGRHGLVVFSGLATGVDAAAHEGALTEAAGTVAVVGTGLDRVYPPRHRELAERIARHGAVISEFALGTPPLAEHFPQRNRLIAGLALGTLVVEAAVRSGSLITARQAAEAGRDVFAIPGSIHSPQSRGCHWLIRQGAKLVETADDIVDELRGTVRTTAGVGSGGDRSPADPLLDALGHDPVTIDALVARTGEAASALAARLLELELDGLVARLPGGLYQRRHRA